MSDGYFRIPRSLSRDPLWIDLPLSYQHVFLVILDWVLYFPRTFDDHGHLIELKAGQICISERDLLKKCSKYISRNEIQRSLLKLKLYGFVSQEVRHKKNILTITHPECYELILKASDPRSEPNLSQTRAKLEPESNKDKKENKEKNKKNIKKEASGEAVLLFSFFQNSLNTNLSEISVKVRESETPYFDKIIKDYSIGQIHQAIRFAHTDEFWRKFIHSPKSFHKNFSKILIASKPKGNKLYEATYESSQSNGAPKPRNPNALVVDNLG